MADETPDATEPAPAAGEPDPRLAMLLAASVAGPSVPIPDPVAEAAPVTPATARVVEDEPEQPAAAPVALAEPLRTPEEVLAFLAPPPATGFDPAALDPDELDRTLAHAGIPAPSVAPTTPARAPKPATPVPNDDALAALLAPPTTGRP